MHRLERLKDEYLAKYYWMETHIASFLPKDKKVKILVLGSGLGHEVWALNRMGYNNVLGVDIDTVQVEIAKSMGINCVCADALEFLEKSRETYDAILAFNFLEHFDLGNALKLCRLCYLRLSKGGVLILLTPNAANPLAMRNIYSDLTHKIGAFTEVSIVQLLNLVGFNRIILCNVKTFGLKDRKLIKMLVKIMATLMTYTTWGLIKLFYIMNGTIPPKVVSNDLLAIAIK
ncbi:MAG: hypothetical protein B6U76_04735 [Desulfurococcales archaeon ex4484_217_2]|nr:MAG: hypothetical protein B6U76_04735 [Desulfurococcales archaeon ex4484_217_2]